MAVYTVLGSLEMKIDLRQHWIYPLALTAMASLAICPNAVARSIENSIPDTAPTLAQQIPAPGGANMPSGDLPRLVEGMDGTAVTMLQVMLRDLGFYDGIIDGNFGPKTAASARAAQAEYDLVQDAVIGSVSWPILLYYWDNR
jgi:peptidoglycan hydrolase-like protein with peptidoglycan-binding domain